MPTKKRAEKAPKRLRFHRQAMPETTCDQCGKSIIIHPTFVNCPDCRKKYVDTIIRHSRPYPWEKYFWQKLLLKVYWWWRHRRFKTVYPWWWDDRAPLTVGFGTAGSERSGRRRKKPAPPE